MRLTKGFAVGRAKLQAKAYLVDFVQQPESMGVFCRSMVAFQLLEIDESMRQLEKLVRKEPGHGDVMEGMESIRLNEQDVEETI